MLCESVKICEICGKKKAVQFVEGALNPEMNRKQRQAWAGEIVSRLEKIYPSATVALDFRNPLELLVATVLSAQSTDRQINLLTPALFRRYRSAADYAAADLGELEGLIHSSGFFRSKAKNIRAAAVMLRDRFAGEVPRTMAELLELPGVARKTANIVLRHAYGVVEGIAVDTHVKRLASRLGLTEETDPVRIERDLMDLIPRRKWGKVNDLLVTHGRRVCSARKPACGVCVLSARCPSVKSG